MRRLLLVCLLTLVSLASVVLAEGWSWQSPRPQGNSLSDVTFVDDLHGWAVGEMGTVIATRDGGLSWEIRSSGAEGSLYGVSFLDTLHGWLISGEGSVYATTDGGYAWTLERRMPSDYYSDIVFNSFYDGWIVGGRGWGDGMGLILHSTDGGHEWEESVLDTVRTLNDVAFLNDTTGWALATYGDLLKTTDGGANWVPQSPPDSSYLVALEAVDNHLWLLTYGARALRSTDGGVTWDSLRPVNDLEDIFLSRVAFASAEVGWIIAESSYPYYGRYSCRTTDGGESWDVQPLDGVATVLCTVRGGESAWMVGEYGHLYRADHGNTWQALDQRIDGDLRRVRFYDENYGWIVGSGAEWYSSLALYTTDGGQTWSERAFGGMGFLRDIAVWTPDVVWVAAEGGTVYYTTNAGVNWTEQNAGTDADLLGIYFVDALYGWAVGGENTITHTTDGGASWQVQSTTAQGSYWWTVYFRDRQMGFVAGNGGVIVRTTDGGASWDTVHVNETPYWDGFEDLTFSDDLHGWAVGRVGVYHSADGGATWARATVCGEYVFDYSSVSFSDPLNGWIGGSRTLCQTTDGGQTWTQGPFQVNNQVTDIEFVTPTCGWAVCGYTGPAAILHYGATPATIPEKPAPVALSFALTAYPNPFNPATQLAFSLPQAGRVRLSVFDLLGREVAVLTDAVSAAGVQRVTFDGGALPSGIYFARLEAAGQVAVHKLVLLK